MIVSIVAMTAAQARGLPPKVEAWEPGSKASITLSLATIAPTGKPLPSAFARLMMSGSMP